MYLVLYALYFHSKMNKYRVHRDIIFQVTIQKKNEKLFPKN
jgi:hypothetical protein